MLYLAQAASFPEIPRPLAPSCVIVSASSSVTTSTIPVHAPRKSLIATQRNNSRTDPKYWKLFSSCRISRLSVQDSCDGCEHHQGLDVTVRHRQPRAAPPRPRWRPLNSAILGLKAPTPHLTRLQFRAKGTSLCCRCCCCRCPCLLSQFLPRSRPLAPTLPARARPRRIDAASCK